MKNRKNNSISVYLITIITQNIALLIYGNYNLERAMLKLTKEVVMNVKKFLILACMSLQITGYLHASQAAYEAAFVALDAALNPTPSSTISGAATFIEGMGNNKKWSELQNAAKSLQTPEAQTVRLYLADGTTASLASKFPGALYNVASKSFTSLSSAIAAGKTNFTSVPTTTVTVDPNANTAPAPIAAPAWFAVGSTPPNTSEIQAKATELKNSINNATATYNTYLASVGKAPVALIP